MLSIIIVNYNVYDLLKNCINSIEKYIKSEHEIIVIDNNSIQRNIENITIEFPYVKFIQLNSNIGFGPANNYAVKYSAGEYLLFLNPDTIIPSDFPSKLIDHLEDNNETGICAPCLEYPDGRFQSSSGYSSGLLFEISEALFLVNLVRKFDRKKLISHNDPKYVKWVSAACLLIKKEVFQKLNGFNEKYFLNYEDIDLCKRTVDKGLKIAYFYRYKCIHLDHKSFDTDYERLVFTRYQSRLIFAKGHYNFLESFLSRIIQIYGLIQRIIIVNFVYKKSEAAGRRRGYLNSLLLFLGIKKVQID